MSYKVRFQHVTKRYKLYNKSIDKLKDLFLTNPGGEYHYALRNISFEVPEGEIIGIVGMNGSGKSTLSNLIAGVTIPNEGKIDINGTATLIAIASGLNGQLTGIQNIELKGLMMGLTKEQIKEITPKVMEFADIGKFMYQPVKTYSSGMKSRLGFAISVHIDPDILVIDEALSVGDQTFTDKCLDKMNEFKAKGKTIFFISHSLEQVRKFCTKVIWLQYGTIEQYGNAEEVMNNYLTFLRRYRTMTPQQRRRVKYDADRKAEESEQELNKGISRKKRKGKESRLFSMLFLLLAAVSGLFGLYHYSQSEYKASQQEKQKQEIAVQKETPKPAQKSESTSLFVVKGTDVVIREQANSTSKKLNVTQFGDVFEVIGQQQDVANQPSWVQVSIQPGLTGWISSQWLQPLGQLSAPLDDKVLQALNIVLKQQYSMNTNDLKNYFGLTLDEMKKKLDGQLSDPKQSIRGLLVEAGGVQFTLSDDKVHNISFLNMDMNAKALAEALGQPILSDEAKQRYFYETKSYYITFNKETNSTGIQMLSIQKKQQ